MMRLHLSLSEECLKVLGWLMLWHYRVAVNQWINQFYFPIIFYVCNVFFPSHNIALLTVVLKNNYKQGLDNFLLHAYLCICNNGAGPQLISYLKAFFWSNKISKCCNFTSSNLSTTKQLKIKEVKWSRYLKVQISAEAKLTSNYGYSEAKYCVFNTLGLCLLSV